MLQELLADYPGTVLLVSHDRDFLDRTVTSIIASEGDGQWIEYAAWLHGHGGAAWGWRRHAEKGQTGCDESLKSILASKAHARTPEAPKPQRAASVEDGAERIDKLTEEICRLEQVLADPQLYTKDREAFAAAAEALGKAQDELAAVEEDWLRLELLQEEIAANAGATLAQ